MPRLLLILLALLSSAFLTACSTAPKSQADRDTLASDVQAALASFKNNDASLQKTLDSAAGYAIFPDIGKAAWLVGGAYGKGEVFEKSTKVGYCDVTQGTVGLQLGAQTYSQLIIFKSPDALAKFKDGKFAFSANASAVAIKAGVSATADYSSGAAVFTMAKGGLMYEASVGGQQFSFKPE